MNKEEDFLSNQKDHEENILRVDDIKKGYNGNLVLKGISFSLKTKECLGILGHSGSGKSVLLRSLICLEYIDSGKIYYKEKRIDQLNEKELVPIRKEVAYIFQSSALFDSQTVFDNVAFPLYEHTSLPFPTITERVEKTLDWLGLKGKGYLMPSELSGGMQKRVSIARAIVMDPQIYLFDEPTAGLDPTNTKNIIKIMANLREKGATSIFVTHDIQAAFEICHRLIFLVNGKIEFMGTPQDFRSTSNQEVQKFLSMTTLNP